MKAMQTLFALPLRHFRPFAQGNKELPAINKPQLKRAGVTGIFDYQHLALSAKQISFMG